MIEIKNLCKKFDEQIVFENFNLEIKDGEFVVVTGASGSGKTTLLNIIGTLDNADSGEILINGKNLKRIRKRSYYSRVVSFLFQNFALVENQTVRKNLEMIPKRNRSEVTIEEALEKVGLTDKLNKKVYKLSGGEQQRVALARIMVKKGDIILADEPTGSLDAGNKEIIMKLLSELNESGKTIIMVTHDEELVNEAERVVYI